MISVCSYINRCKVSWKSRFDVNSTVKQITKKVMLLQTSRKKELKKCHSSAERAAVRKRYDNEIKFYDAVLYQINFEYYEIIGKFK